MNFTVSWVSSCSFSDCGT